MNSFDLKSARAGKGLSQAGAARRLGVSQPYVAMLECGRRRLTPKLARRFVKVYGVPATVVPSERPAESYAAEDLVRDLAALGYPGFVYMRPRRWNVKNPAAVLMAALANDDLDARLVEALPWLLLKYPKLDREWLVREAKVRDLQNRLGFVVTLARRVAERIGKQVAGLRELEAELERSRLAREDTLCKKAFPDAEWRWLKEHQSDDARHWNVVTDWTPDALRYAESASTLA